MIYVQLVAILQQSEDILSMFSQMRHLDTFGMYKTALEKRGLDP